MNDDDRPSARRPRRRRHVPVPVRALLLAAAAGPRRPRHQDRAAGWRRPQSRGSISATPRSAAIRRSSTPSTAARKASRSTSRTPADLAALRKLLAKADVVLQNFRPGVIERLGLDYEAVQGDQSAASSMPRSPAMARRGRGCKRPGQDLLAQARSGVMWLNGDEDQGPVPFGLAIGDMLAGAAAGAGHSRGAGPARHHRQGRAYRDEPARGAGRLPVRGADHPSQRRPAPAEALGLPLRPCLSLGALRRLSDGGRLPRHRHDADRASSRTCSALDALAPYRDDPKSWFTRARRDQGDHRRAARDRSRPTHWLAVLEPADIWCAKVLDWPELLESEGFKALDMLQTVTREDDVSILTTRSPLRVDGVRPKVDRAAPRSASRAPRSARSSACDAYAQGHDLEPSARLRPDGGDRRSTGTRQTGVEIDWDKRSLQDFESFPVEELARHTTSSSSTIRMSARSPPRAASRRSTCRPRGRARRAGAAAVGQSYPSYTWPAGNGPSRSMPRRRCRPIAPICCPSRRRSWDEVMALAEAGQVVLPMRAPHA